MSAKLVYTISYNFPFPFAESLPFIDAEDESEDSTSRPVPVSIGTDVAVDVTPVSATPVTSAVDVTPVIAAAPVTSARSDVTPVVATSGVTSSQPQTTTATDNVVAMETDAVPGSEKYFFPNSQCLHRCLFTKQKAEQFHPSVLFYLSICLQNTCNCPVIVLKLKTEVFEQIKNT